MFNLDGFKYQQWISTIGRDLILICSDVSVKIQELSDSAQGDIFNHQLNKDIVSNIEIDPEINLGKFNYTTSNISIVTRL